MTFILSPVAGEAELSDPAITGRFAPEMAALAKADQLVPWCGYIARRDGTITGFGGFKGAPSEDGTVEIGYLTFPAHEGRGVATEVAKGLIEIARNHGVRSVTAHTLPEENASTIVLRRNDFARAGEIIDPDEGPVWRWERTL